MDLIFVQDYNSFYPKLSATFVFQLYAFLQTKHVL